MYDYDYQSLSDDQLAAMRSAIEFALRSCPEQDLADPAIEGECAELRKSLAALKAEQLRRIDS